MISRNGHFAAGRSRWDGKPIRVGLHMLEIHVAGWYVGIYT